MFFYQMNYLINFTTIDLYKDRCLCANVYKIDNENIQCVFFVYFNHMILSIYQSLSHNVPIQKIINKKLWQKLPKEVLQIIMCYHGTMTDRSGKFVGKIPNYDTRYAFLSSIPKFEIINEHHILSLKVGFSNNNFELYKYIDDIAYFCDYYNLETDTLVYHGKRIDTDVFIFYKYVNHFYWFRRWMYTFPYSRLHL